jgi:hypothetical protein
MTQVVREKNVLYVDTITATNIFEGRMDKTNLLCNVSWMMLTCTSQNEGK